MSGRFDKCFVHSYTMENEVPMCDPSIAHSDKEYKLILKSYKQIKDKKFVRLRISRYSHTVKNSGFFWECKCDCGGTTIVTTQYLNSGNTKSCGCLQPEKAAKRLTKHGFRSKGFIRTPEYEAFLHIHSRTTNPNCSQYIDYGGRGITVCERWKDFPTFLSDMGLKPEGDYSIERIDNNKGYYPNNCKWENRKRQNRNKRNTIILDYDGKSMCLPDWEESGLCPEGVSANLMYNRLRWGWSTEEILTTPLSAPWSRKNKLIDSNATL